MSSVGDAGGESAAPTSGRSAVRPGPVNVGGSAGATRPLKLPDLERAPDA
jgi:hypothetical protein